MTDMSIKKIPSEQPISQENVADVLYDYIDGHLRIMSAMDASQVLQDYYELDRPSDDGCVLVRFVEIFFGEDYFREEVLLGRVSKGTHHFRCHPLEGYWKADEAYKIDEETIHFDDLEDIGFYLEQISEWFMGWLWRDMEALDELLVENPGYDRRLESVLRKKVIASLQK